MKKIVIVVVVLVLALVVAPWGVGKIAEKRLDQGLDKLVEQAPYLKVVDRKWTGGWFKSEQVVTFEVFSAWIDAVSPKAIEEAMKKEAGEADSGVESGGAPADESTGEPAVAEAESAPAKPNEALRFTVHNEVLHGPVLGLTGFGIARVTSHLELGAETQKKITELFGPKPPFEISTRVGFTGGGTTTFRSEGRTIRPPAGKEEFSWETQEIAVGYSRDADKFDYDGKWPKFEINSLEDKTRVTLKDLTLDGGSDRIRGDLYDTDMTLAIDQMSMLGGDGKKLDISKLHYVVESDAKGDFYSLGARFGSGEVKSADLTAFGVELKEIHFDYSVRHLHIETLEKLIAGMKTMYSKPLAALEVDKAVLAPFKEQGLALLQHDPELGLDRIGIVTPEGDGYLKGVIRLKGVTADDFAEGSMSMLAKIDADLTIDVSEKMIQKFPNASTMAGGAVDSGYVERKGERLVCKILFKDGQLTINGKPQAIPGLGGPPPGAEGEGVRPAE